MNLLQIKLLPFLAFLLLHFGICTSRQKSGNHFQIDNENLPGEFGVVYQRVISNNLQFSWTFTYPYDTLGHAIEPEIHTWVDPRADVKNPVVFEVRHHQSQSWSLPVVIGNGSVHRSINKTLCTPPPEQNGPRPNVTMQVIVSTKSEVPVYFSLTTYLKNVKIISFNKNVSVTVSPTSPIYFKLGPFQEESSDSPFIRLDVNLMKQATETKPPCFTVSLQDPACPIRDQQNNVGYNGIWHTMSTTTTITLHRDYFLKSEHFLVFVMHYDYTYCNTSQNAWKDQILQISSITGRDSSSTIPSQTLEFVIRPSVSLSTYLWATLGVAALCLVACLLFALVYLKWLQYVVISNHRNPGDTEPLSSTFQSSYNLCCLLFHVKDPSSRQDKSLLDACQKPPEQISKSANRYFGTLWVVSIFYAMPVVQFVLLYQRVLNKTGNEDLCFFNFRCLHPLGDLTAFNHIFSNIAYVLLGLLFLILVRVVSLSRSHKLESKGIFLHYGIYYAMGSALIMEGLMSAFYHVCPTHTNFQFDTCFMYITAMLCIVKLYHSRHPDSTISAHMAFLGMALVVFLGVTTAIYQRWWLWVIITICHVCVSLLFSLHVYSWGDWKFFTSLDAVDAREEGEPVPIQKKCLDLLKSLLFPFRPFVEPITGMLVALNVLNWTFAVVGHVTFYSSQDIASYLLMLFLLNMTVYTGIYVTLKIVVAKERILWPSWIYFGLSVPFWAAGMTLFFKLTSSWDRSQAESRELNAECVLLNFYDYHDVWHFLSGFGMFFMFMFYFTLDDGLLETERDRIKLVMIHDDSLHIIPDHCRYSPSKFLPFTKMLRLCFQSTQHESSHTNCIEGGTPKVQSSEEYKTEVDCDAEEDRHVDTDHCLLNLEYTKRKGDKEQGQIYEMYKNCANKTFYKCLEQAPTVSKLGNCLVMNFDDYESREQECGHLAENQATLMVRNGESKVDTDDNNPAFVAYCTCKGDFCNERLSDDNYKNLRVAKPETGSAKRNQGKALHLIGTITIMITLLANQDTC